MGADPELKDMVHLSRRNRIRPSGIKGYGHFPKNTESGLPELKDMDTLPRKQNPAFRN
jgi:hypothetical protein